MSVSYRLETDIVQQWIWDTISGDAEIKPAGSLGVKGLFHDEITGKDPFPAIVFQNQAPMFDMKVVGMVTVWATGLWTIKAVVKGRSYDLATLIAERINVLFDGKGGPVTGGGTITECWRQNILKMPERNEQSENYRHLGGIYHIRAQQQ